MFLEISQNSQENTCARDSFLTKLQVIKLERAVVFSISVVFLLNSGLDDYFLFSRKESVIYKLRKHGIH